MKVTNVKAEPTEHYLRGLIKFEVSYTTKKFGTAKYPVWARTAADAEAKVVTTVKRW